MDYSTILVKVTGAVLLIWTLRSIYKHFKDNKIKKDAPHNATPDANRKDDKTPSLTEQLLNNLLLYLWLAFMIIFSSGMILNN
jgi:beta-lactamase regulating signal transducer with metallopeptidase domain